MKFDWQKLAREFFVNEIGVDDDSITGHHDPINIYKFDCLSIGNDDDGIKIYNGAARVGHEWYIEFPDESEDDFKAGLEMVKAMWEVANDE